MNGPSFVPILIMASVGAVVLLIFLFIVSRTREKPPTSNAPATVLPGEASKTYTYKDFARDLTDENVSIGDILDRCKAVPLPEEPARAGSPGPDGGTSPAGVDGGTGAKGEDGGASPTPSLSISEQRQEWFAKIARELPKLKIVPPPIHKVVISIPAFGIPCTCIRQSHYMPGNLGNPRERGVCSICKGTGVIPVIGGK